MKLTFGKNIDYKNQARVAASEAEPSKVTKLRPEPRFRNKTKMENQYLLAWLDKLKSSEKLIIVEGTKDKAALVNIGVAKERIFTINKPLFAVAERLAELSKQVIILTDLDKEGKKLYSKLKHDLTANGVEVDNYFREFLFKNSKLSHIEGIDTYFGKILFI